MDKKRKKMNNMNWMPIRTMETTSFLSKLITGSLLEVIKYQTVVVDLQTETVWLATPTSDVSMSHAPPGRYSADLEAVRNSSIFRGLTRNTSDHTEFFTGHQWNYRI
jgi:hypothetical protein